MKILAGLSGGVDSAVAAYLLKQEGHDVTGVIMSTWDDSLPAPAMPGACLGPEEGDIDSARKVAAFLGIKFEVIDCRAEFKRVVIENFKSEYRSGRTPNPCVWCNAQIKFGLLPRSARAAGINFDAFATGHYAKIIFNSELNRYQLLRAADHKKDQTYFLYRLSQEQLASTLFPLGAYTKREVRTIAASIALPVAQKADSQDFYCGDYNDILKFARAPGDMVDVSGKVIAKHDGIWNYTIGKRKGLGISGSAEPVYVVGLDAAKNQVIVGAQKDLYKKSLTVEQMVFGSIEKPKDAFRAQVKIRAQHTAAPALVHPDGTVEFDEEQMSITQGQSAVFYDGDTVLGGGIIK